MKDFIHSETSQNNYTFNKIVSINKETPNDSKIAKNIPVNSKIFNSNLKSSFKELNPYSQNNVNLKLNDSNKPISTKNSNGKKIEFNTNSNVGVNITGNSENPIGANVNNIKSNNNFALNSKFNEKNVILGSGANLSAINPNKFVKMKDSPAKSQRTDKLKNYLNIHNKY